MTRTQRIRTALAAAVLTIGVAVPAAAAATPEGIRWNHRPAAATTVTRSGVLNCPSGKMVGVHFRTYGPTRVDWTNPNVGSAFSVFYNPTGPSWWQTHDATAGFRAVTWTVSATSIDTAFGYCRVPF